MRRGYSSPVLGLDVSVHASLVRSTAYDQLITLASHPPSFLVVRQVTCASGEILRSPLRLNLTSILSFWVAPLSSALNRWLIAGLACMVSFRFRFRRCFATSLL